MNMVADAINARGPLIDAHLQDILARVQEIALHSVRHGASGGADRGASSDRVRAPRHGDRLPYG